jgi:hypothetical protein
VYLSNTRVAAGARVEQRLIAQRTALATKNNFVWKGDTITADVTLPLIVSEAC